MKKMDLSEAQRLAVETVGKNVCISAGAGSGKTRVLVERFLHLVTGHGLSPREILAITFTEKAANEMKRRIVERLGEQKLEEARREVENAAIGTIHAFSARLLREHPLEARVDPSFTILESAQAQLLQERVLDELIESQVKDPEVFNLLIRFEEEKIRQGILAVYRRSRNSEKSFEELLRRRTAASREDLEAELRRGYEKISGAGNTGPIENFLGHTDSLLELRRSLRAAGGQKEAIQRVKDTVDDLVSLYKEEDSLPQREVFVRLALQFEKAYEAAKRKERSLDFDDLQIRAVQLLEGDTPSSRVIRKIYQEKFREIMVDEFQDTNRLQDRLLELIRRDSNLFVVGDFKQSIYQFRGTDVQIFLEKEKAFSESTDGIRIPLVENYRSRPRLIDFVNGFFETLWRKEGVPFERLKAVRPEEGEGPRIEWLRTGVEKEENLDADETRIREARTLANRVTALVEQEGFQYKDIACLFKAMSDVHFYEHEFRRAGIPHFVVSSGGFYTQPEIRDVLSFLSALENPRRDVPLASALRSPLFQISDETLFWLAHHTKGENEKTPLADGIWAFSSFPEIPENEKRKLEFFKNLFERFLEEKEKSKISELLEKMLKLTSYDLYVLKLRQGERRYANLRKLVELARELESKRPVHLGDFVRFIKGLETQEVREAQAQVEAEGGNVVRLMSVHLAKGLEFPVVILPDLGRGKKQEGMDFLVSEEEGLGLKDTLTYRRNKERQKKAETEESKRVLYVAMTRAREKLVMAGPSKAPASSWAEWVNSILPERKLDVAEISEAPPDPFPFERRKSPADRKSIRKRLEALEPVPLRQEPSGIDSLIENLSLPQKAYFPRIDLPVSAFLLFAKDPEAFFRRYEIGVPDDESAVPLLETKEEEQNAQEELTSAEFGTRVHQILEQAILRHTSLREVEALVFRFTQELGPEKQREILELVSRFLEGPEAEEIFRAKAVHPELPFVLRLPHGLVQGTMDLIYQRRNGEWVILDYKTSRVDEKTFSQRAEEYRIQLELYALAASQILANPVKEAQTHFLQGGFTHSTRFSREEFGRLYQRFGDLQREILEYRTARLEAVTGAL